MRALGDQRGQVERRPASGEFFWLDLHRPTPEDAGLLGEHFGQRAKLEDHDDLVFIVVSGATDDCPPFADLRERYRRRDDQTEPILLLHPVIEALTDSLFPMLQIAGAPCRAVPQERYDFVRMTLPEGASTYHRPPLRFSA